MIETLRKCSIAVLVLAILGVLIGSIAMFDRDFLGGLLYLILGSAVTLFYAGFIFVFLDMAEDVQYIKGKLWLLETKKPENGNNDKGFSLLSYGNKSADAGKDKWKCEECGRVNPDYTGTCACGNTKR